ncbi:NUDIX hydrolase [Halomarina salina]|uniref:NUDIX hydrolase n=1 Tax=Halomarina salina TaxID=1872699 RepID=A0ABD5RSU8_9EURY|nr:NUDIX hydrolase [Halomarina salina]
MSVLAASRHLDRTLATLAAEYGSVEVVGEAHEVAPDEYDRLLERADAFDGCGGAGAWLRDEADRVLLVESDAGWREPGTTRLPDDDPIDAARRAVREQTGLVADLTDVRHVHVRFHRDWTDRDPVPQPFVVFEGTASGTPADGARWHDSRPEELLYERLAELPLAEREKQ